VTSNRVAAALSLCTAVLAVAAPAQAGFVDLNGGWRASWDDALDGFVDIYSHGVVGDAVFIEKSAEFRDGPAGGVFAPIDIVFTPISPNAVGSIVIDDEIIHNSTGADWLDFHMELIGDAAVFDDVSTEGSGGPGPIGFSVDPFTVAAFSGDLRRLDISGGVVPDGTSWFPGVAGGQLWIDVAPGIVTTFTLRETPSVPGPGSLALLALGGLLTIRRRRR
jgi:MYXO-CTERM domain-containing protein